MSKPPDLVQGTLDLLLLKVLALEPMNGYAIGQRLRQVSGGVLQVSDGSLYRPSTSSSRRAGSRRNGGQPRTTGARSIYSLSRPGRRHLEREADNWTRLSAAITRVVKLKTA